VELSSLRVGYTEDFGVCAVDPMVRSALRDRVQALQGLGASCEPLTLDLGDADRIFDILRAESFHAGYADVLREAPQTIAPHVRANIEMAASMTLADRAWAHLAQTRLARQFTEAFARLDVILAPTSPVSPFPWTQLHAHEIEGRRMRSYYEWLALTYVTTLATHPSLALPSGRDASGMPFGLQLVGPLRGDARLLAVAAALERAFEADPSLRRPRPDLAPLRAPRPELRSIVTHPPGLGPVSNLLTPTAV
jgi:amidase